MTFFIFIIPTLVLARAGGGGGSFGGYRGNRSGSVFFRLIEYGILLMFAIYAIVMTQVAYSRNRRCISLLKRLAQKDDIWDPDQMKKTVQKIYFEVQNAWMKRDQNLAKDFLSPQLFHQHKLLTDRMIRLHQLNQLELIKLNECYLVGISDCLNDEKDEITVYIKGSMIDYVIDDRTGKILSGNSEKATSFKELWKLTRSPKGWVLDEIQDKFKLWHLLSLKIFSEKYPLMSRAPKMEIPNG